MGEGCDCPRSCLERAYPDGRVGRGAQKGLAVSQNGGDKAGVQGDHGVVGSFDRLKVTQSDHHLLDSHLCGVSPHLVPSLVSVTNST